MTKPRIGLVLGSGSARGWAHIGIIRALADMGVSPDIVCGSSIGALVGAAHVSGNLDALEEWVTSLRTWDIVQLMDVKLAGGGFIKGETLMDAFRKRVRETTIEDLPGAFGAVATNLYTGREVWLQRGSLLNAVRASIALPGLFSPLQHEGQWLVDGGLVNPVPVSLCRAMGADVIIAVNLNGDIVGRRLNPGIKEEKGKNENEKKEEVDLWDQFLARFNHRLKETTAAMLPERQGPGLFDVVASAINIMQDRITRSRMAGDPPDVQLTPRLRHIGLMEFDRAEEAIAEGRACIQRMATAINDTLQARDGR